MKKHFILFVFFFFLLSLFFESMAQSLSEKDRDKILLGVGFWLPVDTLVSKSYDKDFEESVWKLFFLSNQYFERKADAKGDIKYYPKNKVNPYILEKDWYCYTIVLGKRVLKSITPINAWKEGAFKYQSFKFSYFIEPVLPELPKLGPFEGTAVGCLDPASLEWKAADSYSSMQRLGDHGGFFEYEDWLNLHRAELDKIKASAEGPSSKKK